MVVQVRIFKMNEIAQAKQFALDGGQAMPYIASPM